MDALTEGTRVLHSTEPGVFVVLSENPNEYGECLICTEENGDGFRELYAHPVELMLMDAR